MPWRPTGRAVKLGVQTTRSTCPPPLHQYCNVGCRGEATVFQESGQQLGRIRYRHCARTPQHTETGLRTQTLLSGSARLEARGGGKILLWLSLTLRATPLRSTLKTAPCVTPLLQRAIQSTPEHTVVMGTGSTEYPHAGPAHAAGAQISSKSVLLLCV